MFFKIVGTRIVPFLFSFFLKKNFPFILKDLKFLSPPFLLHCAVQSVPPLPSFLLSFLRNCHSRTAYKSAVWVKALRMSCWAQNFKHVLGLRGGFLSLAGHSRLVWCATSPLLSPVFRFLLSVVARRARVESRPVGSVLWCVSPVLTAFPGCAGSPDCCSRPDPLPNCSLTVSLPLFQREFVLPSWSPFSMHWSQV